MTIPATVDIPAASGTDLNALFAPYSNDIVYIQNTGTGPVVFTADASRSDGHIIWQGTGNPDGEDTQVVPRLLLQNVQFQRSLRLGILKVVDDPQITQNALLAQQEAWQAQEHRRQHTDANAIFGEDGTRQALTVEKADQHDMLVIDCLRKADGCEQRVSVRRQDLSVAPPLCAPHKGYANQYISVEDHEAPLVGGKAPVKWVRPQIG